MSAKDFIGGHSLVSRNKYCIGFGISNTNTRCVFQWRVFRAGHHRRSITLLSATTLAALGRLARQQRDLLPQLLDNGGVCLLLLCSLSQMEASTMQVCFIYADVTHSLITSALSSAAYLQLLLAKCTDLQHQ
jgi:hypothetical protein